jgi:hypothetical protein
MISTLTQRSSNSTVYMGLDFAENTLTLSQLLHRVLHMNWKQRRRRGVRFQWEELCRGGRKGRAAHRELLLVIRKQGEGPQGRHRRGGKKTQRSRAAPAVRSAACTWPSRLRLSRAASATRLSLAPPRRSYRVPVRCAEPRRQRYAPARVLPEPALPAPHQRHHPHQPGSALLARAACLLPRALAPRRARPAPQRRPRAQPEPPRPALARAWAAQHCRPAPPPAAWAVAVCALGPARPERCHSAGRRLLPRSSCPAPALAPATCLC